MDRRDLLTGAASLGASNLLWGMTGQPAFAADPTAAKSIYEFSGTVNGVEFPLSLLKGKVVAITNFASL